MPGAVCEKPFPVGTSNASVALDAAVMNITSRQERPSYRQSVANDVRRGLLSRQGLTYI